MKIRIIRPFTGYPGGVKTHFAAGETVAVPGGISQADADAWVGKQLAEWIEPKQKKGKKNEVERPQD